VVRKSGSVDPTVLEVTAVFCATKRIMMVLPIRLAFTPAHTWTRARAGQALRGSSEFHAWGDSNLYLRRTHDGRLVLSVEQRAAPSIAPLALDLHADADRLALQITADKATHDPPPLDPAERIVNALAAAHTPVPLADIREACRIRTARLCQELAALVDAGRVLKAEGGYVLASPSS
jgi:hypothetical protein